MVCLLLRQKTDQINGRGFMYLYRPWDKETMSGFTNFLKTKTPRISRRQLLIGLGTTAAVLIVVIVAYVRVFVDEPLRRTVEHNVNQRLKGYTARIGVLHFHPLRLSLDLEDTSIVQDAHPEPPVAHIPLLHAGVHWRALLHGRFVADFLIDSPKFDINLRQAQKEVEDKTPVTDRGWQDALQEIYPLKINVFRVENADITYVDEGPFKPLRLSKVNFQAYDIRNTRSKQSTYPSEIHLDGILFDSGKVVLDGRADFLAKPFPGIKSDFSLQQVELDYFKPIIQRYHVDVRKGILSTDGMFEYAPDTKATYLKHITIEKVQIDYVHQPQRRGGDRRAGFANGEKVAQQLRGAGARRRGEFEKERPGVRQQGHKPELSIILFGSLPASKEFEQPKCARNCHREGTRQIYGQRAWRDRCRLAPEREEQL